MFQSEIKSTTEDLMTISKILNLQQLKYLLMSMSFAMILHRSLSLESKNRFIKVQFQIMISNPLKSYLP